MRRTRTLNARLSDDEYQALESFADQQGLGISGAVRPMIVVLYDSRNQLYDNHERLDGLIRRRWGKNSVFYRWVLMPDEKIRVPCTVPCTLALTAGSKRGKWQRGQNPADDSWRIPK